MLTYAKAVNHCGESPYTEREALASLDSAYSKPARKSSSNCERQSVTERFVKLARRYAEFTHTNENVAYAIISSSVREVLSLKSKQFRQWLSRLFYEEDGKVPSASVLDDALLVLEGQALFEGREITRTSARRRASGKDLS